MIIGCGAPPGGFDLVATPTEAVIQGRVLRAGAPVPGAYVRLLDADGQFAAEVPTSAAGQFRFFARNGDWTLRTLAPGAIVDRQVVGKIGSICEVDVELTAA